MPPTRIVHVSRSLDVGGQERLLVEFARRADRRRFALHFVSLTTRGVIAQAIADEGWPVTALEQPEGLRPAALWRLARFFQEHRADVVHTHDDKPLIYSCLAVKLAGVPRFIHTHHHGPLPHVSRRQLWMIRAASYLTDRFACVSHDSARYMIAQGVPKGRVLTLHNGIDLERFPFRGPDPYGPAVCVARLSPEKDIGNLLHATALVRRQVHDFRLEIAGDGPLRSGLHELARQLDLDRTVRFLGEVHDIPGLLARARLFVLPSQTEGISLTILEAMARGLPVVATRVGGNQEVVVDGQTGLLVPPAQTAPLADALMRIWSDAELAAAWGREGRRRVEDNFAIETMIAAYERLYLDNL